MSQVVSFVLVFSLVATTVGVVSVVGFDGLSDRRDAERVDNAERAFDVLADNVEDVYRDGAPSRATEIKLDDAALETGSATTVKVDFPDDSLGPFDTSLRPIVFEPQGRNSSIVYEAGAVIRVDDGNAVMLREPPLRFDEDRSTASLVVTGGEGAVGGSTTVLVRTDETTTAVLHPAGTETAATPNSRFVFQLETAPERAPAWETFLEAEFSWVSDACTRDGGRVTCEVPAGSSPDELYLSETVIEVTFE
ncbi:hypothetical protein N0B31_02635 [Salinirubellus salinus]|uniref:Secreted glycoprotein n=1 Tax=Salinirubellus salinus TaxID=1364945 RepID=A0A9E7UBK8_9EURY|nr:hypothetical protein [Salinirubellus salinus]UWM55187.1 hypothetical protein N0B31_02635 [Salinirubellus salinus]